MSAKSGPRAAAGVASPATAKTKRLRSPTTGPVMNARGRYNSVVAPFATTAPVAGPGVRGSMGKMIAKAMSRLWPITSVLERRPNAVDELAPSAGTRA
jgi:hypothetical protein